MSPRIGHLGLRLPLMAAPMSIASSRELVSAAACAGILGCFPTHNAHRAGGLAQWIQSISDEISRARDEGVQTGQFAVNINASRHKPAALLKEELDICRKAKLEIVTTNAGNPSDIVSQVHDWGGIVIHDATTVEQAEKAAEAGVDGLMLVCAGAGGLAGALSPFAFVPKVRSFFDGIIQLAGGAADGASIAAAEFLGADMVCMGTRFIATQESGAPEGHKHMLVEARMKDVLWTDQIAGIGANFLIPSIVGNGLDPSALPDRLPDGIKPWSMVWSGGQSAALVADVPDVQQLVERLESEYQDAIQQFCQMPRIG